MQSNNFLKCSLQGKRGRDSCIHCEGTYPKKILCKARGCCDQEPQTNVAKELGFGELCYTLGNKGIWCAGNYYIQHKFVRQQLWKIWRRDLPIGFHPSRNPGTRMVALVATHWSTPLYSHCCPLKNTELLLLARGNFSGAGLVGNVLNMFWTCPMDVGMS